MSMVNTIKDLCELKSITITELERNAGLGRGTIRNWDKNFPSIDKVVKIADYFNVTLDFLINRETKQNNMMLLNNIECLTDQEREELLQILQMSTNVYLKTKGYIE